MDDYLPTEYRQRIAIFADDLAAGANTLPELLDIYKALCTALNKGGIQVKASKVEYGVDEVTFHNYRVIGGDGPMANTTTPKSENMEPIANAKIPQTTTQMKAFLGGNPANGPIRTTIRDRRVAPSHADAKGLDIPLWRQMDPRINL